MTQRVCKRCLLRELDGTYFQSIYEYIQNLPPQWKADQETYAHRLKLCKACGHLVNGMCELCGCFCGSPRRQDKPALRGNRPAVVSTL